MDNGDIESHKKNLLYKIVYIFSYANKKQLYNYLKINYIKSLARIMQRVLYKTIKQNDISN